eukprot:CAMPEP_0185038230 /NCGR_PEP_ID=MMETSP1103-20130426/33637_1 /TAXON_ID=36769 /ORGANISM="Paraphysomonas bandaiensis, Strain Caron Lab Isolate" /LENGTH=455 /DNA_ID=CAMNT_0027576569 /DNA_START=511 /DNA_END=1878 /DNA_ORIENTATION=-
MIGPKPGLRILEQYKLTNNGLELNVSFLITTLQHGSVSVARKYQRSNIVHAIPVVPIPFVGWEAVCNWRQTKSHTSNTLRNVQLDLTIDKSGESRLAPNLGSPVVMYRVDVSLDEERKWVVYYRYRQFHALRSYICRELATVSGDKNHMMPAFPPRSISTLSEEKLEARRQGLFDFMRGVVSQGGFECQNVVDVLSAFLEIPSHWTMRLSDPSTLRTRAISPYATPSKGATEGLESHSAEGAAEGRRSLESTGSGSVSAGSYTLSPTPAPVNPSVVPVMSSVDRRICPFYVTVKSARQRQGPMFPGFSVYNWVPYVEYELQVTRVLDNATHSVFRRFKDITGWFCEIKEVLSVTLSPEAIAKLNFPAYRSIGINAPSSPSKVDVNGNFVRFRIVELERCIQALLKTCPDVLFLPLVKSFLELHNFDTDSENGSSQPEASKAPSSSECLESKSGCT